MRIKVGDVVQVISGDDRGTQGRVIAVDPAAGKVTVEGVNRVYKHVRPTQKNPQGGRLHREAPILASKVQLVDPASGKPTRVGVRTKPDGAKERVTRKRGLANVLGVIRPAGLRKKAAKYAK